MRKILILACAVALGSCTPSEVEPIPGSITYGGQPRTKLTKAPIGSTFTHQMMDETGRMAIETYRIEADRSLTLIRRQRIHPDFFAHD
ncbi:hypothetical protein JNB71_18535 [Rhizobium herbae]|uniref:Transmembrane protein n=1 Tax=Rhizobium herbae TaxID=508661 RepID=A0ABS7HDG9_9HYPH|nr:hypothetical protein [Rhizobium herbae]MBW9065304.1 hypothetical protein [Rhizobium herbae]